MLPTLQPNTVGLAGLLAVVGMIAAASMNAVSAAALPEILWCMEDKSEGQYETEAKCEKLEGPVAGLNWESLNEVLAGETWELMFSSTKGLMTTSSGSVHIECEKDSGSIPTMKLVGGVQVFSKGTVTYTECKELSFGSECSTPGQASGTIVASELEGELVYLKAGKTTPVGVLLQHAGGTGSFTTIECVGGIISETVTGALIGQVTAPTTKDTFVSSGTISFAEVLGKQEWTKVEEGTTKYELTAFGEQCRMVSTETTTLLVNGVTKAWGLDF